MYRRLGSFHHRLHKGIGRLLEDKRETDLHPVDTQIVGNHFGLNEVLLVAGITHRCQCIED